MEHDRVTLRISAISCGVMEASRINEDAEGVLYAIASRLYHPSRGDPVAFVIFSDINEVGTNSKRLIKEIESQNLGTVFESNVAENPKTANAIIVYVWNIRHKEFKDWYSKARVSKLKKVGS